jgi:Abi-like protein
MNSAFYQYIENILHTERIDAYRQDKAAPVVTLARYMLNMALSESLYPALQFAEIALRNAVHRELTVRCGTDSWYDCSHARLTTWQQEKVAEAKVTLSRNRKPLTPGRIVAELTFGFWTGFFNNSHARTGIGSYLSKNAFPYAPASEKYQAKLDKRWLEIRDLRNRVFHHERILHWKDLDARHQDILEIIAWMSPELRELAVTLDRFRAVRRSGLNPWLEKLDRHWSDSSAAPAAETESIATVESVFDASDGAQTPFGRRWGGDVISLTHSHIESIQQGQTLALDVMSEYVVFLKMEEARE